MRGPARRPGPAVRPAPAGGGRVLRPGSRRLFGFHVHVCHAFLSNTPLVTPCLRGRQRQRTALDLDVTVWFFWLRGLHDEGPVGVAQSSPGHNLRKIVNYRKLLHNIAQYREISRTRQPGPGPGATCCAVPRKRPLINTPIKTAALRALVTLEITDQAENRPSHEFGGGKRARRHAIIGQYRQISSDIA